MDMAYDTYYPSWALSLQLVDLKAAFYSKQREVASERKRSQDSDAASTRKVSDKVGANPAVFSRSLRVYSLFTWYSRPLQYGAMPPEAREEKVGVATQ